MCVCHMLLKDLLTYLSFRDVRTREIKPTTGSIKLQFYFRRPRIPETETLKRFRRVEKCANEAETVSVFYFDGL